jgi:hypothetical protein
MACGEMVHLALLVVHHRTDWKETERFQASSYIGFLAFLLAIRSYGGAEIGNDPNWLALPIGIGLLQEAAEDLQPVLPPWG